MRLLANEKTEFKCQLFWGRDPRISLSGVASLLSADSVVIELSTAAQLVPPEGRRIRVELEWPNQASGKRKSLVCSATVDRAYELDGTSTLHCRIRSGKFRDAKTDAPGEKGMLANWTM